MTKEEAAKLLPIIKAYSEGKTIQIKPKEGKFWSSSYTDINFSDLFMRTADYRIKPESKYRPFKDAEECWNEMQKHKPFGWVIFKETGNYHSITDVAAHNTFIVNKWICYKVMYEDFVFTDNTPFGVKEEK